MKNGFLGYLVLTVGIVASLFSTFLINPSASNATGFSLLMQGAKELGMENSVIANTQGPASNFWNPALITELDGTQFEVGTTLIFGSTDFKSDTTGETSGTDSTVKYTGTFYVTHKLNDSLSFGFGINNTFGLSTDWPDKWEGRYITTKTELDTYNFNPNVAWKVSDRLSIGGGFDILYGDACDEARVNLSLMGLPDGDQEFEADGFGYGFNLGVFYRISDSVSFGASYRSGIDLELDGKAKFGLPPGSPPELEAMFPDTDAETTLELPPQIFAGLAFEPTDNFVFEIGGKWEGWSSYEELKIDFDDPVAGSRSNVREKDWNDSYIFNVGAKYSVNPTLAFSAGYFYGESPIPDKSFETAVPLSDEHAFSLGILKALGGLTISVTYVYEIFEDRDKDNSVGSEYGLNANGEYKTDGHLAALSLTYKF